MMRLLLGFLMMLAALGPTTAQPAEDALQRRADDIVRIVGGTGEPADIFTAAFIDQVPPAQIAQIGRQLVAANGTVQRIERIEREGPNAGIIHVGFERAIVQMRLIVEPQPPHRVQGLLITGTQSRGADSAAAILGELRALPGQVSFQIARLGEGGAVTVAEHEPRRALAIGSAFKLIILAELSRQVRAGERRWDEVVPIDRHSLPSGILQEWPLGSPLTLQSLASLMISISDNTATDVLLRRAGRENVERMIATMGLSTTARNRPFLTTLEAFQLKADTPEVRARWAAANEAERRRLLAERYGQSGAALDVSRLFADGPTAIDTVEWFASAEDMVRVMNWLRRNADDTATAIMAINSGIGRADAGAFAYLGFKGGSEPGVINLTFLVRNNAGAWHVVTGSWNNPATAVEEARFVGLLNRAVRLVR